MGNVVTLSESAYKQLLTRITHLEKMVISLVEKFETEPEEGTKAWWEWADKKGREAIKKGEYTTLRTQKDLDNFFKNL